MIYNIALVKGDGIGPEIGQQALLVLDKIAAYIICISSSTQTSATYTQRATGY